MKSLSKCFLMLLFIYQINPAQNHESYIESLAAKAVSLSPKVKALSIQKEIAGERIAQSTNLPDPMLNLGLTSLPVNSFSFTQEPMTGKVIGLSQSFPFPGKLNSMENVLGKDIDIAAEQTAEAKNEVRRDFLNAYYELWSVRKSLEIAKQNKLLLNQVEKVVRTKYTVSSASQSSLMKLILQSTHLDEQIEQLSASEKSLRAVLNNFLFLPADTEISMPDSISMNYEDVNADSLLSLAKKSKPSLRLITEGIEKSKLSKASAEYDYLPNFSISVQYSQRDRIAKTNTPLVDFFSVMAGISLPLNYGGKISAKVNESELMGNMLSEQYASVIQNLKGEFESSAIKLKSLEKRISLFNDGLYPQSVQAFNAALAGYQVGQIDFMNVMDAQTRLLDTENSIIKLRTDYLKEINKLEYMTGSRFN